MKADNTDDYDIPVIKNPNPSALSRRIGVK